MFFFANIDTVCCINWCLNFFYTLFPFCWEYSFQSTFPCIQCFFQGNCYITNFYDWFFDNGTNQFKLTVNQIDSVCINFCYDSTKSIFKQHLWFQIFADFYTQLISKGHFADSSCNSFGICCICRCNNSIFHKLMNFIIHFTYMCINRYIKIICFHWEIY